MRLTSIVVTEQAALKELINTILNQMSSVTYVIRIRASKINSIDEFSECSLDKI